MESDLLDNVKNWIKRIKTNSLNEEDFREEFEEKYRQQVNRIVDENKDNLNDDHFIFIFQRQNENDNFLYLCLKKAILHNNENIDKISRMRQLYPYYCKWVEEKKMKLFIAQRLFYLNKKNKKYNINSVRIKNTNKGIIFETSDKTSDIKEEDWEEQSFGKLNRIFRKFKGLENYSLDEFKCHCELILSPKCEENNFKKWLLDKKEDIINKINKETEEVDHITFHNITYADFEQLGTLCVEHLKESKNESPNLHEFVLAVREGLLRLKYVEFKVMSEFNKKKIRKESIKTAVAAIMSRNMSHNLGSHVITNSRYQIENLSIKSKDSDVQKQLNGVSALLGYLQERQDFIAVIANEEQYSKGSLNFKLDVFDMLAMDGPAKRHASSSERQVYNYVLDNIVRSEEIYRNDNISRKGKFSIEIQMIKEDDKGEPQIFRSNSQDENNSDSSDFANIQLAVPYGLNGRQAFLIILENLIRNAAKHDKEKLTSDLIFSIIIKETNENYEITIADNKKNYNNVITRFKENGILDEENKLKKLNLLSEDIIGGVERTNKGIKEILIALSWLKSGNGNAEYSNIEDKDDYNHSLLKIVGVDEKFKIHFNTKDMPDQNISLGYWFTIDKYFKFYEVNNDEVQRLQRQQNDNDFYNELKKLTPALIYIFPQEIDKNLLERVKKHLTRVLTGDLRSVNNKDKFNKVIALYKNLIKNKLYNDKELPILIAENKINSKYDDFNSQLIVRKDDDKAVGEFHKGKDYILYINHYENKLFKEKNIDETEKATCEAAKFVEGISGGNYTHNLIRTKINEFKYLKIIEAALTKIAIVDERIFHKFNGITTNEYVKEKVKEFKQKIDNKNESFMFYKVLEEMSLPTKNLDNTIEQEIIDNFEDDNKMINIFATNFITNNNEDNYYYDYLVKKNIFVFNSKSDNTLDLIDLNGNTLSEENSNFDFMTIHLGLIDKIKEINNETAEEVIEKFKAKFSEVKLIIHSGRGGLASVDNVGFIPFSGIDWAVDNCKYVLSELFYGQFYI